jgi:cystathionine beta-lyase
VTVDSLRRRGGRKWTRYPDDVIPAWIADADTNVCPAVRLAIEDALDRGDLVYPSDTGEDEVAAEFASRQLERFGWDPDPAGVRLVIEAIQAVSFVVERCTGPGEPVGLHTPAYPPILTELATLGRPCRSLPWSVVDGDWSTDLESVLAAADEGMTLLILVNPHNPTGRVWRRDELERLAEVVVARDLVVVADEIHAELTHEGRDGHELVHVPFASVSDEVAARTVTLTAASKSFNTPGVKCLVAHVGASRRFDPFRAVPRSQLGEIPNLGVEATLGAWRHGDDWLEAFRDEVAARRAQFAAALDEYLPDAVHLPPDATYLAWVDARPLDLPGEPADFFLERARVALSPGPSFGPGGAGHVRVNLATTGPILDEIVERMVTAVDLWRARG